MSGALDDITVVDLTEGIAGPYATKLLADYGADVIKVESPAGDPTRSLPPFLGDRRGVERSATFFYFNTNKRSVVLDLESGAGRAQLLELYDRADVVVESFTPGTLSSLELGWEAIRSRRGDLPLISVSDFGQTGPYSSYRGTDLVLYAFGGEMYSMGLAEREPVKMYGTAALVESGAAASTAILAATIAAKEQAVGQHVDFSIVESHLLGADRRHAATIAFEFNGQRTRRRDAHARGVLAGAYPCRDGYVEFTNAGLRIDRVRVMLDDPDWLRDPKWDRAALIADVALTAEFDAHFYPWLVERTKAEIWERARDARVLCGPLFTPAELMADPHFRERGFWVRAEHRELGEFEMPGAPFKVPRSPWRLCRPAPMLGEHTEEALDERAPRSRALPSRATVSTPELPLGNLRVLDICVVWAGPFATMLLGDLGAEVLKLENPFVMQPMTRGVLARPPKPAGPSGWPNGDPGRRPWNYMPTFVQQFRNKKSFTLDTRRSEGMELLSRIVAQTDVVVENNATETLDKLGITYEWLKAIKPDIIMVRMPAFGITGPYSTARALGVHLESVMGHSWLRGYADTDPTDSTAIFSADYIAGAQACLAVMIAAWHRRKTGEGQLIELSQAENASAMLAQAFMDEALNGRTQQRLGNRSVFGHAPAGVYPCKSVGPLEECGDRWIAIEVTSDQEWRALVSEMGDPGWATDTALTSNSGRLAAHDMVDAHIAAWTSAQDDYVLFHRLQRAGIRAAPVLEAGRTFDDPHVQARGLFERQRLVDDIGVRRFNTPFYRMPATPIRVRQAPVAMGEHNSYVYRELLGLDESDFQRLVADGHISMEFDPSVP